MKGSLLLYNLKLNCLIFFYWSKQLTDYIYTDIYCKLSKCIGQTPHPYERYLVFFIFSYYHRPIVCLFVFFNFCFIFFLTNIGTDKYTLNYSFCKIKFIFITNISFAQINNNNAKNYFRVKSTNLCGISRLAVDMEFPIHIHIHINRFSVDIHGYIHIHRRLTCVCAAPILAKYSSARAFNRP